MKKFTQTTLIALLISTFVFAQKGNPGNQAVPSQTTVIVGALRGSVILLSPADGKSIAASDASKPVLFRWTAVSPKPKEAVTYRLKVWQLMQGQNAAEAMRTHQPIVTKDVVNITQAAISNLYTGPCKPPYLCDFIWAVEVFNGEGVSIGNSSVVNASFKFEVENSVAENVEGGNKGNAGNTGMSGGKSLDANGDPVHGVDVKLGMHAINLPIEKIIYDADGNVIAMSIKSKNGGTNILLDESKQTSKLQMNREEYIKALQATPGTTAPNPKMSGTPLCWVQVFCRNPNHAPGCGWWELRPCGGWNLDRPR